MAPADRRRVHLDGPAGGGVLQPPALLRARAYRRGGEGLTSTLPVTANRRWFAIAVATLFATVSFWAMAYGLAVGAAGTPADPDRDTTMIAAAGVALAVLLMPAGFAAAAFISRRPDAPIGVLYGMGLALGIGLPLLWFGNPLAALIAGYAAGAVVTVAPPEGATWHNRAIAAAAVVLIALAGMATVFVPTAVIAPGLPFTAVGLADLFAPRRT